MTKIQYNTNNSLTSEFKRASFEKRNNLDELINISTKTEERSVIQILAQSGIRVKLITGNPRSTVFSKSANPLDLPQKSTIRAIFKDKSVDPNT